MTDPVSERRFDGIVLKPLYHQGKKGQIYVWKVRTEDDNIITEYGLVDGEQQTTAKQALPKNVGRSNQTTGPQQAQLEARAMWQKKLDRKYALTPGEAQEELIRPMLAHDYAKRAKKLPEGAWPAYVQPKLDGVRALAYWDDDGQLQIISRSGKCWLKVGSIGHIAEALRQFAVAHPEATRFAFDGEIYAHGESFQQTTRLVKKYRRGESEQLVLHVYDVIDREDMELGFGSRFQNLRWFGDRIELWSQLQEVDTEIVNEHQDLMRMQANYLARGYEGAMLRLDEGGYQWGARSYELLKVKQFQDAEFTIIGHCNGVGRFENAVVWTCRNDLDEQTFQVVPKGSMEERAQMLADAESYYGQRLTVRFFERSEGGVPRFPVGVGVRPEEDQP